MVNSSARSWLCASPARTRNVEDGWALSHRRLFLAGRLNLGVGGNQFPDAEYLVAVVTEARLTDEHSTNVIPKSLNIASSHRGRLAAAAAWTLAESN